MRPARLLLVRKLDQMDELVWARLRDTRPSSGLPGGTPAGKLLFEGTANYQNMVDEGLRLHRAFGSISNPALREAIITLVTELTKSEIAD